MKNRELRTLLRQLGFQFRQHGGSHQIWTHPVQHRCRVTLCGHDGDDAPKYQEARVKKFVKGIMKHDDTRCNKIEVA